MITQPPSFTDHKMNLQRPQQESLREVLQHLHQQKILSNDQMALNITEIATALNQKIIELSRYINATNDLSQKINLLSAQVTIMNSMTLIATTLAADTKADTKRINALLYLR